MHSKLVTKTNQNYQKLEKLKFSYRGRWSKTHARDQSYKTPKKISKSLSKAVSLFLKVRLFSSRHMVHIRQEGIKFHTPKDFFPNQFHQPNKRSETRFESTQSIPTERNTKLHITQSIQSSFLVCIYIIKIP